MSIDYSIVANDLDVVVVKLNVIVEENQLKQIEQKHVEPIELKNKTIVKFIRIIPVHNDLVMVLEMLLQSTNQHYDV